MGFAQARKRRRTTQLSNGWFDASAFPRTGRSRSGGCPKEIKMGAMSERIKGKTLVAREEGDDAYAVTIKVYGDETNGAVGIIEQWFEPGFLLRPHMHENDVWLYVPEGEMHVRVRDEVVKATAGCWVLKPRRVPHTMWNAGPESARIIEVYTPGGFELFFKDFGKRLQKGPIGLEELNRVGEPHGIRFFDDWIPELKAAYNLRLIGEGADSSWAVARPPRTE
jgi:mannose-6-phosphate isomerase-like protein (cupin superfamily)